MSALCCPLTSVQGKGSSGRLITVTALAASIRDHGRRHMALALWRASCRATSSKLHTLRMAWSQTGARNLPASRKCAEIVEPPTLLRPKLNCHSNSLLHIGCLDSS